MLNIGEVLVVSPNDEVRQNLADTLAQCGLEAVLSSTIAESQTALDRNSFRIVFCADQLVDGNYRDIVREVGRTATKVPVIVVSRLDDWGEYLKAIRAGAFDYLGSPPRRGEIEWAVRNALLEPQLEGVRVR